MTAANLLAARPFTLVRRSPYLLSYSPALVPLNSSTCPDFAAAAFYREAGEVETMTKAELVEDVARAAELTKKDAERLVEIVFESIIDTLNQGEKIELRGFGSFRVRERGARRGRNPKTGDPVDIPAKRVPYFKPGKELKELINEDGDGAPASSDLPSAEPGVGGGGETGAADGGGTDGGQTTPLM
ncbi:MAG: HU family DNA-binding protein [Pyrinomonadaceae bacterium]